MDTRLYPNISGLFQCYDSAPDRGQLHLERASATHQPLSGVLRDLIRSADWGAVARPPHTHQAKLTEQLIARAASVPPPSGRG
jgi:hypothetical protein